MDLTTAVRYLRHGLTEEHGEDHLVDAESLTVVLDSLEQPLESGIYCRLCGWYESEPDVEGESCSACGCERGAHVPAKVVQVSDEL